MTNGDRPAQLFKEVEIFSVIPVSGGRLMALGTGEGRTGLSKSLKLRRRRPGRSQQVSHTLDVSRHSCPNTAAES